MCLSNSLTWKVTLASLEVNGSKLAHLPLHTSYYKVFVQQNSIAVNRKKAARMEVDETLRPEKLRAESEFGFHRQVREPRLQLALLTYLDS